MEKVLPNVLPVTPQSTGYWCGPASTRIVLQAAGINVPEAELAREIGTHTGGTDHIGWIVDRSLAHRAPAAGYAGVPLHQDPPTPAQQDALWNHVTRSIDAGWGVVMNWVAPPGNYPIGIKGSTSPSYGPGTIYHYVACVGYDSSGQRAVWIADPGFRPFSFWVSFRQAATLIPPKAYAWAAASKPAPPGPPTPPPAAPDAVVLLERAMGAAVPRERYAALLPAVGECLRACQCDNLNRVAMWMGQIGHESGGLRWMEEIADGSAYEGRQDLGNTQPGDGRRFKGRGPIQVTGRHNYSVLSKWAHEKGYVPSPTFFVDNPTELASDRYGFLGVTWYWTVARPQINAQSDRRDLEAVTRAINGGLNGLADRRTRWERALAMGEPLMAVAGAAPAPPGEEFLMALTPDEQREMLALLRILADDRTASISPFRHLGSEQHGAVTMPRRVDFIDANLHAVFTMLLASIGDPSHMALLAEVAGAAGDPRYGDRQADAAMAARVLAWAEQTAGVVAPEVPVPPPFVCGLTGTSTCRGGGEGTCSITISGQCVHDYER